MARSSDSKSMAVSHHHVAFSILFRDQKKWRRTWVAPGDSEGCDCALLAYQQPPSVACVQVSRV